MSRVLAFVLLLLMPFAASAQYVLDWQVTQDYYEYGYLYYDFTGDSVEELVKPYGNTVYVFDGAQEYAEVWTITSTQYEYLTLWDDFQVDDDTRIVLALASNSTNSEEFQLRAYEPLADLPLWITFEQAGAMSYADAANLDADSPLEIVVGCNEYQTDDQTYVSRFIVLDGSSGAVEFESGDIDGFMVGPYAGDIDGDGFGEILINLYNTTELTSALLAYSFTGTVVEEFAGDLRPNEIELQPNFPNPFNPNTTIPLILDRAADVSVNVVNVQGQLVQSILSGRLAAGRHEFHWNGRDTNGARVASGLYFAEVITDGHRIQRPMVLLK